MPTHDGNDYLIGMLKDDSGNYFSLAKGQIDELDLHPNEDETVLDFSYLEQPTTAIMSFRFTNKSMRAFKRAFLPYYMTNNWRKMHHLKMHRYVIGKKWKRRKYHGDS